MKALARRRFRDFGIILPMNWAAPQGSTASEHFQDAFKPEERSVEPEPAECLFKSATRNKLHVAAAVDVGELIGEFLDGVCDAISKAWATWQAQATMSEIVVNGPVASAGRLSGPSWAGLIRQHAPNLHPVGQEYLEAIASVMGETWKEYEATVKVPALPWYPSFALAFGAAPPTANVPSPISVLTQGTQMLTAKVQSAKLCAAFGRPEALHHAEVFESVAYAVEQSFSLWQKETNVTQVVAQGPASPLGGPVVGGTASMMAGGLV